MPSEPIENAADSSALQRRPDFSHRAPLSEFPEWMDEPCSREEMRACLHDLAFVNRVLLGYRPILAWLDPLLPELRKVAKARPVRLLDVACGYGDTLRRIARWASANGVAVELTGIDLNADTIAIAAEATDRQMPIRYVAQDVFAYAPDAEPDLIVSSLFTHHLEDAEIVRVLRWMDAHARMGWCINDLSRHPLPYTLFGWFARLLRLHRFVRHDGPVSIARAFREEDWQRYCAAAGLRGVEIRGFTPGRLRVSRSRLRLVAGVA